MTPEKFAKQFIALDIPLTEDEWCELSNLLEKLKPGITKCLLSEYEKESAVEADAKCSSDFHKEEYSNGSTFCRVCGKRIRTA